MTSLIKEFREFILRGNLVDLAVAVVIGTAFGALVNSLVENLITPINDSKFGYGNLINALITFVSIAAAVFFFVVKPVNELMARFGPKREKDSRECPQCLSEIPVRANRCAFCTAEVGPAVVTPAP